MAVGTFNIYSYLCYQNTYNAYFHAVGICSFTIYLIEKKRERKEGRNRREERGKNYNEKHMTIELHKP